MYVVWAFIVILLFLHFDLSEIIAFAHYTITASPLQKHAHYPCFTLVFLLYHFSYITSKSVSPAVLCAGAGVAEALPGGAASGGRGQQPPTRPRACLHRHQGPRPQTRRQVRYCHYRCQLSQYSELAPTKALTQKNLFRNFCRQSLHIGMLLREDLSAGEAVFKHIFSSGFF